MRRFAVGLVGVATLGVLLGAFDCSGPTTDVADAESDVLDVRTDKATPLLDGGCTTPALEDAPPASFWLTSGWQRLGAPVACCAFAVASSPDQLPPLKWIPCKNGALDCVEDEVTWSGGTYNFMSAVVSRDGAGQPRLFKFMREQGDGKQQYAYYEDDVYDFATQAPVLGWRQGVLRQAMAVSSV